MIVKPYSYSMGILGLLVAGTTAKNLTDSFNRDLPATNQINNIATLITAIVGFLLLSSDPLKGGFSSSHLGTSGLLAAFIAAHLSQSIFTSFLLNGILLLKCLLKFHRISHKLSKIYSLYRLQYL